MTVKLFVEFDAYDGIAVPDGRAAAYVTKILQNVTNEFAQEELYPDEIIDPIKVRVGTSLIIDYFRLAVVAGSLKPEEIKFTVKNHLGEKQILDINEKGRLSRWPENFCNHTVDVLSKLA
jgi:hypothetical protein